MVSRDSRANSAGLRVLDCWTKREASLEGSGDSQ